MPKNLFTRLKKLDITIKVVNDSLDIKAPKGVLNEELLKEIKACKSDLINLINQYSTLKARESEPIPVVEKSKDYPLSSSQNRLWVLSQIDEANRSYNIPGHQVIDAEMDVKAFFDSLKDLFSRHEIFRTVFKVNENDEVRQYVQLEEDFMFPFKQIDIQNNEEKLAEILIEENTTLFNLEKGPLFKGLLIRITDNKWIFSYNMHHIISDEWSIEIMINELLESYQARKKGSISEKEPLRIQYKDYAVWQQQQLISGALKKDEEYWLEHLKGDLPVISHFGDFPRPAIKTYRGGVVKRKISKGLYEQFKTLYKAQEGTLFMGCLSLLNILLHKYSGQKDLIIGSPISGRTHTDLKDQIGFYVNTLALRTQLDLTDDFEKIIQKSKAITLKGFEHQNYPFDELLDNLNIKRDLSRSALFDVMISVQNGNETVDTSELSKNSLLQTGVSKYDLTFTFIEAAGSLVVDLEYNNDIYSEATSNQLLLHLEQLLEKLIELPKTSIATISCLNTLERYELLESYNATETFYNNDISLISLFKEQVTSSPGKVALVYQEVSFTYAELDVISNQFSHYLEAHYDLKEEDLIAIALPKSHWQIISILGILKASCAYVPIALDLPKERMDYIISDTDSKIVVSADLIARFKASITKYSKEKTVPAVRASSLAYVMYTSGSTGEPKGVLIEQGGILRLVKDSNYITIKEQDTLLSTGAFSFDATTFEYWSMFLNGSKLVLCNEETLLSSSDLSELIKNESVTMMWFTSGLLNQLVDESIEIFEGLKTVLVGGDRLSPTHIHKLQLNDPSLSIINGYGPTENTTFSLTHFIEDSLKESIPIGKPISHSSVYILDEKENLVPKGVVGELYLGGNGLARGYLNQENLTKEKFVSNPFKLGERLYKTGDLGRWNSNGEVEFIGRVDTQIKLRGFRIELGEIEYILNSYPGINASLVIVDQSGNDKILIGYVTSEEAINDLDLRDWLSSRLPHYMVPSYLHVMKRFPLTVNGKIDRSNLPGIEGLNLDRASAYIAPVTDFEVRLSKIWEEILGITKVGTSDNFFELGGHSLKATKLISKIHKEFNVKLRLQNIFTHSDLFSQSKLIASKEAELFGAIPALATKEYYPLSAMQRRLWILSQLETANVAYNMPGVYRLKGALDVSILEQSFIALISRHEILRTNFRKNSSGEINQYISSSNTIDFTLEYQDVRDLPESYVSSILSKSLSTPFNLSKGFLLRANIYQVSKDEWVFSNVIHHIISDGWSMEIMVKELLIIYNSLLKDENIPLAPLRIQYKDYASWQLEELNETRVSSHKEYWLKHFEGELPVLDISGGKTRPSIKTYNGAGYNTKLSKELSTKLSEFLQKEESTLFMGLLSIVNALFYHYTAQEDIIIGSPIAGRDHTDLEDQIGFYVNTLALRTQFSKGDNFEELLSKVKEVVLGAHAHQLYPFDELVSTLGLHRDMSRNPLFDVQVIVQNESRIEGASSLELEGLSVAPYQGEVSHSSIFDLVFNFIEREEGIFISTIYNTDVFSKQWLVQMHNHLEVLLDVMLSNSKEPLSNLSCLSKEEERHLLDDFNALELSYDRSQTVVSLIEEQAKKTPNAIAISYEGTRLSYLELEERSNQLAHYLVSEYEVSNNDLIALLMDRSELMFIGILGVLKTGSAYVPIDPDYPVSRKEFILKDTQAKVLLTQSDYIFDLSYYSGNLFAIDLQLSGLTNPTDSPSIDISSSDLVYIIYTSGSTGNPKGVLVSHENLMHSLAPREKIYRKTERFLLLSSISFDSSVAGIFGTLTTGGQLHITKSSAIAHVSFIADYIITEQISHLLTVPSYYRLLLNALSGKGENSLKEITVAGEHCPLSLVSDHYSSDVGKFGCSLFNEYGPTECTVWSSVYKYKEGEEIRSTIGKPIANTRIYILNEASSLVPEGVIGELCIAGAGVTQGYLNRPELTKEKFVSDPFNKVGKMYKTGDLGRWNTVGEIEFLGRQDTQIKIRGYRLELGEVENAVLNIKKIKNVVVTFEDAILKAHLLTDDEIDIEKLKRHLKSELPTHAIPSEYCIYESFPLLPNGKIDKKKLIESNSISVENKEYIKPSNDIEKALVEVFKEVLRKDIIGINDEFYALGGDSIKAIQIISRLKQRNYSLAVQDVMQYPAIHDLALYVKEVKEQVDQEFVEGIIPLSPIQKHFFKTTETSQHHYNQSVLLKSNIEVSEEGLNLVFKKIIAHHDALRIVYNQNGKDWIQEINNNDFDFKLTVHQYTDETEFREKCDYYQSSFNLEEGPLFKVILFKNKSINYLLIIAHHLVIDGVSWRIFFEDLMTLYSQFKEDRKLELPLKTHSFKYWQEKQIAYASSAVMAKEEKYWQSVEEVANSKSIELPKDFDYKGGNFYSDFQTKMFQLNDALTEKLLTESHKAYKTTINDVLITALTIALNRVFNLKDSVIQLEGHGREDIDSELDITRTIGWFTSIFPIHIQQNNSKNNIEQLIEVKETLHRIPNKGIGYGILKYLKESNLKIQPDISFNYLGDFDTGNAEKTDQLFQFSDVYKGKEISSKIERTGTLDISGILVAGQLQLMVSYNSNFLKKVQSNNLRTHIK